ncbi:MAG TPA: glycosyltransferase [Roseiflexaceae bacterium]|nr:glycosyltransferase [Roseiflexaceae bacterium]
MSLANQLDVSVVINTYNRASHLRQLLAGLRHLRGARFEVIVVNGPSTDGTAALLAEYHGRVKVVDCPTRNLSHSRNLGIAAAAGDIVVFIDDDALPGDRDWLARYVDVFGADPTGRLGAAGGPVWHRDTDYFEFNGGAISDYGFQIFDKQRAVDMVAADRHWVAGVRGCNCAFRRTALLEVGGFDEFYTYYLDESDVCMRLSQAGYTIAHLPDNTVRHYSGASDNRATQIDRNWRVIARSDTYYAIKNGLDSGAKRLLKTLAAAPRKHFVGEINHYLLSGSIPVPAWARAMRQWLAGVYDGLRAGLERPRQLGAFDAPPALLPFRVPAPEQPLRVALLSQSIPGQPGSGGIGRYTFDLAQGLHERGHEIHVICKDEQPLRRHSLGFSIHGIPKREYAPRPLLDNRPVLNKNLSYGLAVARQLARLRGQGIVFDVVHASNWDAEAAALIRARLYPTVLMLVSPLAQVITAEGWPVDDDLRACVGLDRWQIEHADMICVPSEGVLGSYQKLMGITPESLPNLRIAPLGIMPDLADVPAQATQQLRLLFVGRCEKRKGAHILLDALPRLLAEHPQWECHLVGDDSVPVDGSTLKQRFLARHQGAPWLKQVIFHGPVAEAELRRHYQQCDLFVAPSLFESFGLIYHEAMQYGKAVVGCRTGGVPEVVTDGVEGLLVEPGNLEQLQAALAQLMNDGALRERMGAAGARRVQHQQNYQTMAARMEVIYLEAAAERNEIATQPE